jgi:hypothetical protein
MEMGYRAQSPFHDGWRTLDGAGKKNAPLLERAYFWISGGPCLGRGWRGP